MVSAASGSGNGSAARQRRSRPASLAKEDMLRTSSRGSFWFEKAAGRAFRFSVRRRAEQEAQGRGPLAPLAPRGRRYSYNYEGNSQTLDHVFVTRALRDGAEVEYVHLNADYPALPGATASDHDPLVARVRW